MASCADQKAVISMGYPGKRIHTNDRGKVNCMFSDHLVTLLRQAPSRRLIER